MIIYLHGFRSSPQSFKARLIGERMAVLGRAAEYVCPQLSPRPAEAVGSIRDIASSHDPAMLTLIGSSLGGYYATWLAEQLGCRAVLLNPAMGADQKLRAHLGPQTAYHGDGGSFDLTAGDLDQLRDLKVGTITRPERYMLVAATGDEVLDWREMVAAFPGVRHKVIHGSDHGLSDFRDYMDEVLSFAGVR
ncbi:MAG: YqiA/YcfP family alpha/beta fold hydrolase [Burkholderiales bacterium]